MVEVFFTPLFRSRHLGVRTQIILRGGGGCWRQSQALLVATRFTRRADGLDKTQLVVVANSDEHERREFASAATARAHRRIIQPLVEGITRRPRALEDQFRIVFRFCASLKDCATVRTLCTSRSGARRRVGETNLTRLSYFAKRPGVRGHRLYLRVDSRVSRARFRVNSRHVRPAHSRQSAHSEHAAGQRRR